ncbi:MAG TPA: secondary thiamine-phosphate synthase enzyme YjbQ [Candidatus Mcinerneyibacteriales bacterium]|nr:secondary thiamine-phosphate synthase enzyme YjbQ [Candidatus Mcinerneyibacteriales bacterium]HPE20591.1 secondary thiamine-phosphate synthase enzyme YjbQ [Candidatus Mcinerneyibacteriales bacterium]
MIQFSVKSTERTQFIDITREVAEALTGLSAGRGYLFLSVPHTTCALTVNESYDPDVAADINAFLNRLIPEGHRFRHVEGNSDAHIKAALIGTSLLLPLEKGELLLGTWQGIFLCEFDGPRTRTVRAGTLL